MLVAVGDLHGERWKWEALKPKLPKDARWIFLGDYVDRGPDVKGLIDDLIQLKIERPETVFLRGNHDQLMLDSRDAFRGAPRGTFTKDHVPHWLGWGGTETIASYGTNRAVWHERVPHSHWEFLSKTRIEHIEAGYHFVHAGLIPPGIEWEPMVPWDDEPRLWIRDEFIQSECDFGNRVVFGHTVQRSGRPLVLPNKIGIDTGAVYGGPLTAVVLDGQEVTFLT